MQKLHIIEDAERACESGATILHDQSLEPFCPVERASEVVDDVKARCRHVSARLHSSSLRKPSPGRRCCRPSPAARAASSLLALGSSKLVQGGVEQDVLLLESGVELLTGRDVYGCGLAAGHGALLPLQTADREEPVWDRLPPSARSGRPSRPWSINHRRIHPWTRLKGEPSRTIAATRPEHIGKPTTGTMMSSCESM
jgi:hypothetical protein